MMSITGEHSLLVRMPVEVQCPDWCNTEFKVIKYTCEWTIQAFGKICSFKKGNTLRSHTFMLGNADDEHEAYIVFYPKGDPSACGESHTSISLQFVSYVPPTIKGRVKFRFEGFLPTDTTTNPGIGWGYSQQVRRTMSTDDPRTLNCTIYLPMEKDAIEQAGLRNEMKVLDDFYSLLETASFSDVSIRIGGQKLRAHKYILAARSPVFKAMLEANMTEKKNSVIHVMDVEFEVMQHLLRLIYSGRSDHLEDAAEEVMVAADKYGVEDVKAQCGEILSQQVSVENAARLMLLADRHRETQLIRKVFNFIKRNKYEVKATEGWKEYLKVCPNYTILALAENQLDVPSPRLKQTTKTRQKIRQLTWDYSLRQYEYEV